MYSSYRRKCEWSDTHINKKRRIVYKHGQIALKRIQRAWKRYKRLCPYNANDPISLEPLSSYPSTSIFKIVSPDGKHVTGLIAMEFALYLNETGDATNPLTRIALNAVEISRLNKITLTAPKLANSSNRWLAPKCSIWDDWGWSIAAHDCSAVIYDKRHHNAGRQYRNTGRYHGRANSGL